MLTRRAALGTLAATLAFAATPALAQDWKSKYPELVFAIVPAENASGVTERYTPFVEHLSKELGVKVTLRIASDYAALVEGQKAGNIHIGMYGPSAYARAVMVGAKIEPFAIETNLDGTKGYHSVFYVKKDSPYQKIEDLKGKNIGLVDPNSASGNNVPRYELSKMGIDPETYFGKVVYTGSHENAIIALGQGTVDVAANWYNDENESNLLRMERKKMVNASDFRIIYKSAEIVNSPMAYLADLPEALKAAIRTNVLELHTRNKAAFDKIYNGKQGPLQPITHDAYKPIMELNKFVDDLRRKKAS